MKLFRSRLTHAALMVAALAAFALQLTAFARPRPTPQPPRAAAAAVAQVADTAAAPAPDHIEQAAPEQKQEVRPDGAANEAGGSTSGVITGDRRASADSGADTGTDPVPRL